MNINQIPDPPIKPTKLPKIVKDLDKEARFHANQPISYTPQMPNQHAEPSKGGLFNQMSKYLEDQQTAQQNAAQKQRAEQVAQGLRPRGFKRTKKKSNPIASVFWILFFVFIFAGGNIFDAIDNVDNDSDSTSGDTGSSQLIDVSSDSDSDTTYIQVETNCLRMTTPESTTFNWFQIGDSECDISFERGFSLSRAAFADGNGLYYYADVDEYLSSTEQTIIQTIEINGRMAYQIDDGDDLDSSEQFLFWVRDMGILNESGDVIETISVFIYGLDPDLPYTTDGNDVEVATIIRDSIEILEPSDNDPLTPQDFE